MSRSHPRKRAAVLRAAAFAAAAVAVAAPAAHAADGPVVTGISERWIVNLAPRHEVISGSGFTGATAVTFGGSKVDSFTVVSDHTIVADARYSGTQVAPVQVTAGGITSPVNAAATFRTWVGPDRGNFGGAPVECSVAGGRTFSATLNTELKGGPFFGLTSLPVDQQVQLGGLRADLVIPQGDPGSPDELAQIVGNARVTSITADITGSPQTTTEFAAGPAYSFPVATSVDANQRDFEVADFSGTTLQTPNQITTVRVRLHEYRAAVDLVGGGQGTLSCVPSDATSSILSLPTTAPAPELTSISPTSGPTTGGTKVRITGSGLVDGMFVRVDGRDATDVRMVSPTELEATLPPHAAGKADVAVGSGYSYATQTFTYVGSTPLAPTTATIPFTCTLTGGTGTAHPVFTVTADVQPSVAPGEPVGLSELRGTLSFSPADVDAMRPAKLSADLTGGSVFMPLTVTGTTGLGTQSGPVVSGDVSFAPGTFGGLPAGGSADLMVALPQTGPSIVALGDAVEGQTVHVGLAPFSFRAAGAGTPTLSCAPDGDGTFVSIPVGSSQPVDLALKGSATLKTVSRGALPLTGTLTGSVSGEAFAGQLALNPTQATLIAAGFLPIQAKLAFVSTADATGTITRGGPATLTGKYKIKLPSVTLFGIPLASSGCQTGTASSITLNSTAFTAASGGNLIGSFAIGNLTGCGALQNLVQVLTAGTGNALALKATPAAN